MKSNTFIIIAVVFFSLISCSGKLVQVDDKYFIDHDPAGNFKTLFYDLGDGNAIERVRNVKRVGKTNELIIAENDEGFFFIEKVKDNEFLNASDIVKKVSKKDFKKWLVNNRYFEFEYIF